MSDPFYFVLWRTLFTAEKPAFVLTAAKEMPNSPVLRGPGTLFPSRRLARVHQTESPADDRSVKQTTNDREITISLGI